ncbi:MAG: hypothetical protein IJ660_05620 [Alphaproteobacteria bacterium]|nr:hypothetical protein [Alphaproteobacteria bacterium]
MTVFIKEDKLKQLRGIIDKEEKDAKIFPETDLLKRCTKMKASQDGKKVELLSNKDELLGTLNREDDAHCNLDIVDGYRLVGRYITTSSDKNPTWTIYDTNKNKTSKIKIIDEERIGRLKGLFNDMRNASERSLKLGRESVSFRNRNSSENKLNR